MMSSLLSFWKLKTKNNNNNVFFFEKKPKPLFFFNAQHRHSTKTINKPQVICTMYDRFKLNTKKKIKVLLQTVWY